MVFCISVTILVFEIFYSYEKISSLIEKIMIILTRSINFSLILKSFLKINNDFH